MTFEEHKNQTIEDCEQFVEAIKEVVEKVRQGNMFAFHDFFIEDGTEEGDAQVQALRELLVLRYVVRSEQVK